MALTLVVHVGAAGEAPGGMAQLLNEYKLWKFNDLRLAVWRSTRRRRDPLAPAFTFYCLLRLICLVPRRRKVVIVFHLSQGGSFLREGGLLWVAHALGLPALAHIHGSSFVAFSERHGWLVRRVLSRSSSVLVLSEQTRRAVLGSLPKRVAAHVPVRLVDNGVSVPERNVPKEKTLLFGGEVGQRKGADTLVAAWRSVVRELPDWQLVLMGPIASDFRPATDLPRLHFAGAVSRETLLEALSRSSVAVLPSRDEAMPMFLLEAMARSNAVIATPVGRVAALISGERGQLVEPGNPEALADAIRRVCTREDLRSQWATAAKALVDVQYSARALAPVFEELWLAQLRSGR